MMLPKVSVIVPIYKAEAYLGLFSKCLKILKMVCVSSNFGLPYTYHF